MAIRLNQKGTVTRRTRMEAIPIMTAATGRTRGGKAIVATITLRKLRRDKDSDRYGSQPDSSCALSERPDHPNDCVDFELDSCGRLQKRDSSQLQVPRPLTDLSVRAADYGEGTLVSSKGEYRILYRHATVSAGGLTFKCGYIFPMVLRPLRL